LNSSVLSSSVLANSRAISSLEVRRLSMDKRGQIH
jgi:hypothetical protein